MNRAAIIRAALDLAGGDPAKALVVLANDCCALSSDLDRAIAEINRLSKSGYSRNVNDPTKKVRAAPSASPKPPADSSEG